MEPSVRDAEQVLVDRLVDLIAIPSLTGNEEGVGRYILGVLSEMGAQVEQDAAGNITAIVAPPHYRATCHVAGHMDTVPPGAGWTVDPYKPIVQRDRVIGLGASDMKSGLSGMLWCVERLRQRGPRNVRFLFDFTICEEGPAPGKRNGVNDVCERYGGDYAITAEASGGGDGRFFPAVGSQAHLRATAVFCGRTAHSAYPERGTNAIVNAAAFVERVTQYNEQLRMRWRPLWEGRGEVMARPSVAATTIEGGVAVNVIPDRCTVQLSRRTAPGETFEAVKAEIEALLEGLGDAQVQFGGWDTPFVTPADSPLIEAGRRAMLEAGQPFEPRCARGRNDTVIFARHGMHTYNMGPGSAATGHAPDEYCLKADLVRGTQLLEATIRHLDALVG